MGFLRDFVYAEIVEVFVSVFFGNVAGRFTVAGGVGGLVVPKGARYAGRHHREGFADAIGADVDGVLEIHFGLGPDAAIESGD